MNDYSCLVYIRYIPEQNKTTDIIISVVLKRKQMKRSSRDYRRPVFSKQHFVILLFSVLCQIVVRIVES